MNNVNNQSDQSHKQFVILEGVQHGNRFYSRHTPGEDPTKSAKGETWYRILGYADTSEEAQAILFPNPGDAEKAIARYMVKTTLQMYGLLPINS